MGLRKKGSRLISVGKESYRWAVSRSIQAVTGYISVNIEAVGKPGRRIVVRVPCRDFWLDFSDLRDAPAAGLPAAYRPVTPAMARKIISAALIAGWSPRERQKNLAYEWTAGGVLITTCRGRNVEKHLVRKRR